MNRRTRPTLLGRALLPTVALAMGATGCILKPPRTADQKAPAVVTLADPDGLSGITYNKLVVGVRESESTSDYVDEAPGKTLSLSAGVSYDVRLKVYQDGNLVASTESIDNICSEKHHVQFAEGSNPPLHLSVCPHTAVTGNLPVPGGAPQRAPTTTTVTVGGSTTGGRTTSPTGGSRTPTTSGTPAPVPSAVPSNLVSEVANASNLASGYTLDYICDADGPTSQGAVFFNRMYLFGKSDGTSTAQRVYAVVYPNAGQLIETPDISIYSANPILGGQSVAGLYKLAGSQGATDGFQVFLSFTQSGAMTASAFVVTDSQQYNWSSSTCMSITPLHAADLQPAGSGTVSGGGPTESQNPCASLTQLDNNLSQLESGFTVNYTCPPATDADRQSALFFDCAILGSRPDPSTSGNPLRFRVFFFYPARQSFLNTVDFGVASLGKGTDFPNSGTFQLTPAQAQSYTLSVTVNDGATKTLSGSYVGQDGSTLSWNSGACQVNNDIDLNAVDSSTGK